MRLERADDRPRQIGHSRAEGDFDQTRRRALIGVGAALVGAVAGCASLPGNDPPEDQEYTHLHRTAVYVDDDVDLAIPDDVPTVDAANDADLVVVPGDTGVEAEQAVDWLADDRALALLGDGVEDTWFAWARSDAYDDAFGGEGASDADPDPQLLVAAAVGLDVPTYRHTWGDGPRDRDVLGAIDEALADVDTRTPR